MNLNLKFFLIGMTVVAVVSDTMLIPFYPQFFASAFGIEDPAYVGTYLAAYCFVVMLAFPGWALAARKIAALKLLIYTQVAAGVLSMLCYWTGSVVEFWVLSLAMMVFKGSYLLIYPLVMSLEHKSEHGSTIGLLSVVVHFGAILGALLGGMVLQLFEPRQVFLVMAAGDFIQTGVCVYLLRKDASLGASPAAPVAEPGRSSRGLTRSMLYRLSLIMLLFYFSAYLVRPFFVRYWESVSALDGEMFSGLVYAIPAFMALLALWLNRRMASRGGVFYGISVALVWGGCGLLLQASQQEIMVILGRCLFGWALFQSTVRLDMLLYELSSPESYATDFSKIHFFQSLGVLLASYAAGYLVAAYDLQMPFMAAALGLAVTLVLFIGLFRTELKTTRATAQTS